MASDSAMVVFVNDDDSSAGKFHNDSSSFWHSKPKDFNSFKLLETSFPSSRIHQRTHFWLPLKPHFLCSWYQKKREGKIELEINGNQSSFRESLSSSHKHTKARESWFKREKERNNKTTKRDLTLEPRWLITIKLNQPSIDHAHVCSKQPTPKCSSHQHNLQIIKTASNKKVKLRRWRRRRRGKT